MNPRDQTIEERSKKYLVSCKDFKDTFVPRIVEQHTDDILEQNASNCWLYSGYNNSILMFGTKPNKASVQGRLTKIGIDIDEGGFPTRSGLAICDHYNVSKKIKLYQLDLLDENKDPKDPKNKSISKNIIVPYKKGRKPQVKIFAELLMKGYRFMTSRNCTEEVLADIRDNGQIDQLHKFFIKGHAVNSGMVKKTENMVRELGNWGKDSIYNDFVYKDPILFINLVRSGAINRFVYFLDFEQ